MPFPTIYLSQRWSRRSDVLSNIARTPTFIRGALVGFAALLATLWNVEGGGPTVAAVDALGARSKVQLVQLRYTGGHPVPRPTALERLAWEIDKRTSIDVAPSTKVVSLADADLFLYPLLYMSGDRAFVLPPEAQIRRLRRFLIYGGTLVIDSAEARPGGGFDKSVRALLKQVLPDTPLERVTNKHVVYKSFYLLDEAVGRVAAVPYLDGIVRDGRLVVLYSQNDLGGAWARDAFGQWEHNVYPGGQRQRELAFRWGINLVMYALCDDYKDDQVHIPFILKRRQWRVSPLQP